MNARRIASALGAAALGVLAVVPARAGEIPEPAAIIAEGSAVAFTLRPTYDAGGANPLHFYIGYADANLSQPEPVSDGQASWYNFGIAETAAFRPPENCTPSKNAEATRQGLEDVQSYINAYFATVVDALQERRPPQPPTLPGPRHACTERLSGFAQSRYPETQTIPPRSTDNYLDKGSAASACREDPGSAQCNHYKQFWPSFRSTGSRFARDGSFAAEADRGSQRSESLMFGAGDGTAVSIGVARTTTTARVISPGVLVVSAASVLDDICVIAAAEGCALHIDRMRQDVELRSEPGKKPVRFATTVVIGVRGRGAARDVTAKDLLLDQVSIDLGGGLQIQAVNSTGSCATDDPETAVVDAGGLRIGGKGGATTIDTRIAGAATIPGGGGAIMLGGACASARTGHPVDPFIDGLLPEVALSPGELLLVPGAEQGARVLGEGFARPGFGPPRITTQDVVKVFYRRPIAWRTAPYWGSILAALGLLGALGFAFRRTPVVAPAASALDRFARQFLRG